MAQIILFGGGDGGGIRITPHGIEPIPPFDPAIRLQLQALNTLTRAGHLMSAKDSSQAVGGLITKLSGSILTQLEALVGEIDANNGLIYQDDDGGFTCGSTGKPPIPFPWPVNPHRMVEALMARGLIDGPTLAFLQQAVAQKMDVFTVAHDPQAAARKLGIRLSPEVEQALLALKLDKTKVEDPVDKEVIEFYQKVVQDGRFIKEWVTSPTHVADQLKLKVSPAALERVLATRDSGLMRPGGEVMSPAVVAVAIAIVVVLWDKEMDLPVLDRSGLRKF